ncbi:BLOC-1-related complex subunit 5 [Drosophila grimshawi]|uniref:BLOC-1-related complex subunit 5 n=1 Tax=Drosophila grimshawi TaxID=7222 RepID=B4JL73_DROGR|nr:BLOC-1-related complex subunit 5 [Drosophila grimshawi]EDW00326.1 GH12800 [Drosophila grimshawi]
MGAEQSQPRIEADGHEIFERRDPAPLDSHSMNDGSTLALAAAAAAATNKRRGGTLQQRQQQQHQLQHQQQQALPHGPASIVIASKQIISDTASPTSSELSRPPSPPLSVCSDLPYVSYTDRPIGDSPKIRNRPAHMLQQSSASRAAARKSHPGGITTTIKPKRPQSTASSHNIVIVKPGARDTHDDIDPDLTRLRNIPQFLPVLRESISSATYTRDAEILERLHSQHLLNICGRMQTHLNLCASHVASEQNHLVERTKVVSNSITTLFASFVDMQKTYASYAEQFAKIRGVSQQLSRCNSLLHENIASLEAINNFLDDEDRLEPFVWRTDDNKLRGEAEGAAGGNSSRLWRL